MSGEWQFPNRATPLGSSAYYSLRFAPSTIRDDLAALLAWRHQVTAILEDVSDPVVARRKLQWWREELDRTLAGGPQHPLSKALRPVVERHGLPRFVFVEIADRVESRIQRRQPTDEAALGAACEHDLGGLFELLARCHGLPEGELLQSARAHGSFCARVYLIRDSGALARRGEAVLPLEQLRAHGLTAEAMARPENRRRLPELLAPAAVQARAALAAAGATEGLPACIRVRTRIMDALLEEIERTGFDVADQRVGLTPLRKLWLAWRASRRQ